MKLSRILPVLVCCQSLLCCAGLSLASEAFDEAIYRKCIQDINSNNLIDDNAPETKSLEESAAYYYSLRKRAKSDFSNKHLYDKLVFASPRVKKLAQKFPESMALRSLAFQYTLYPDIRLGDCGADFAKILSFCMLAYNTPRHLRNQTQYELAETFAFWLSTMLANYIQNEKNRQQIRDEALYFWNHSKVYPSREDASLWKTLCLQFFKEYKDKSPRVVEKIKNITQSTPSIPERNDIEQCWFEMLQIAEANILLRENKALKKLHAKHARMYNPIMHIRDKRQIHELDQLERQIITISDDFKKHDSLIAWYAKHNIICNDGHPMFSRYSGGNFFPYLMNAYYLIIVKQSSNSVSQEDLSTLVTINQIINKNLNTAQIIAPDNPTVLGMIAYNLLCDRDVPSGKLYLDKADPKRMPKSLVDKCAKLIADEDSSKD